jgi:hypothetical protein
MSARLAIGVLGVTTLAACGGTNTSFIVVTVDGRPAVHDVVTLHVTLTNDGSDRSDDLMFGANAFPATFSISAPGRSGELDIAIDALDANGVIVGHGTGTSTLETSTAEVQLDSTDFVINTDVAGDQFLSKDFEASGNQLAAITDGTWTAVFRDGCLPVAGCNLFGRRFDVTGSPVTSVIAAGTQAFPITTDLTTGDPTPGAATSGTTTIAVWDFDDPVTATTGIACRSLDATGSPAGDQVSVSTDVSTDVVSATPLDNGNFALTWNASVTNEAIRAAIVKPDCTPVGVPVSVAPGTSTTFPHRAAVTANGSTVFYAWIDGGVHTRTASVANVFESADTVVIPVGMTEEVEHVRLAPFGTAFAVIVRWEPLSGTGEGRIELYKALANGTLSGPPLVVTSKSGGDFLSVEAFGVAPAPDGSIMVVWSACAENGDGNGCGVFGQIVGADDTLTGGVISLATTTLGDQTDPSVVALPGGVWVAGWADASATAPDTSGLAARARIIYPP